MLQACIQRLDFAGTLRDPAFERNIERSSLLFNSLSLGNVDHGGKHLYASRSFDRIQADLNGNLAAIPFEGEKLASAANGARLRGIKRMFRMARM